MSGTVDDDGQSFPGKPLGNGLYEVDDEFLKHAVLFKPGMVDHESADLDTAPSEPITAETTLEPVDVVIFYDRWSSHPLSGGCNQWGFVVDNKRALFSRAFVHSITLNRLRRKPNAIAIRRIPRDLAPAVAALLVRCRWRPALFKAAINFLQCNNYLPFLFGHFFPNDVSYEDDATYDVAWDQMVGELQPHDAIFTFDRKSRLSRLIAFVTHGPFSHAAVYIGDGNIWEIVTSGARVVPIETYKDRRRYRVAVYRHYGFEPTPRAEQLAELQSIPGMAGLDARTAPR